MKYRLYAVLVLCVLLTALVGTSAFAQEPEVFTEVTAQLLSEDEFKIEVQGVVIDAKVERTFVNEKVGTVVWFGRFDQGTILLVGSNETVTGRVRPFGKPDIEIGTVNVLERKTVFYQVDHADVVSEDRAAVKTQSIEDMYPPATSSNPARVDIMIVCSIEGTNVLGGVDGCKVRAELIIQEANLAYQASGIHRIDTLVFADKVSYNDSGSIKDDLDNMRTGKVQSLRALRDQHSADLVQMLVGTPDPGLCGVATLMLGFHNAPERYIDRSVSVVIATCPRHIQTGVHEIGHNSGAFHECNGCVSPTVYPYCYAFDGDRGPTVMVGISSPNRLSEFSRFPEYGIQSADNTLCLNNTGHFIASLGDSSIEYGFFVGPDRYDFDNLGQIPFMGIPPNGEPVPMFGEVESKDTIPQLTFSISSSGSDIIGDCEGLNGTEWKCKWDDPPSWDELNNNLFHIAVYSGLHQIDKTLVKLKPANSKLDISVTTSDALSKTVSVSDVLIMNNKATNLRWRTGVTGTVDIDAVQGFQTFTAWHMSDRHVCFGQGSIEAHPDFDRSLSIEIRNCFSSWYIPILKNS